MHGLQTRLGPPALIVIAGPHGSGKTAVATQLSRDLGIPRLDPDVPRRAIESLEQFKGSHADAMRMGYAVLWRLAGEFLDANLSVIIDVNMGWELSWHAVDALRERNSELKFLPIVLTCPQELCLERIGRRHRHDPQIYGAPDLFAQGTTMAVRKYLDGLDRPEVRTVDASVPYREVYTAVRDYVAANLPSTGL
jgi:predicted kinase